VSDTFTFMVGIFASLWMVLFFGGSAVQLRKTYEQPASGGKIPPGGATGGRS
jgi:hypothetical protein